ncbi:MAG: rhodanese-like domain-containing protein [Chthoniobacterales bacterium]|nr:rhodanese-like domain-containing protein [Chthoniobacterales bacterium]
MTGALIRQAALLLVAALVPAVAQAVYHRDRVAWNAPAIEEDEVTLEQARAWGEIVLWIDARPDSQFAQQHVPNALSLNEDRWDDLLRPVLETWSPDRHVVVYCSSQSCAASHEVARRLRKEAGLPNVFVLHGGWEAWLEGNK